MADDKTINLLIKMGLDKSEAEKVRKGVKSVDDALKDLQKTGKNTKQSKEWPFKKIDSEAQKASTSVNNLAGSMKGLIAAAAASSAAYAIRDLLKESVELARVQAQAEAQLAASIESTGGAAGLTATELKKLAGELQGVTNFGDEATIEAEALLLTFTNIRGEIFTRTVPAILDLSAKMDQDLKSSTLQLGKALNDPIEGLSALSRAGVQFTDAQKDTIETMVTTGDVAGAQAVILSELERQFGGSAEAARKADGSFIAVSNSIGDLKEALGNALLPTLTTLNENLITSIDSWTFSFKTAKNLMDAERRIQEQGGESEGRQARRNFFRENLPAVSFLTDQLFDFQQGVTDAIFADEQFVTAYQEVISTTEEAGKAVAAAAAAVDTLTISQEDYNKALAKTKEAQADLDTEYRRKIVDAETDNLRDIAALEEKFSQERLDIALDFEREMADIARDLAQERVDIAEAAAREIADIERKYAQEYADAGTDYRRDVVQIDRDLADNRLSIERDYQQRLADIRREFEQSAEEAVRNNDAIAFLRAQRQRDNSIEEAQTDRTRQLEEAQITAQQRREQLRQDRENELADLRVALERELEEQRTNTARKLQDAQIGSNRKIEEARRAYAQELQDQTTAETRKRAALQTAYQQQLTDLQQYYNRRLVDTRNSLQAEYQMIAQYTAQMRQARSAGISSAGGANYSGMTAAQAAAYGAAYQRRGVGGYAGAGLYQLGESGSEYVMNAAITRQMEQALGGRITSGGLSSLANRNMSMSNTFNFSERDDSRMILAQVDRIVTSKLTQLERGY